MRLEIIYDMSKKKNLSEYKWMFASRHFEKEDKKDTSKLSEIHLVCAENDSGTLKFTFSNGVTKAIRIEDLLNKDNPDCKVIARGVPITHAVYSSSEKKGESDDNN